VQAAQGATVDRGYVVTDGRSDSAALYVGMTAAATATPRSSRRELPDGECSRRSMGRRWERGLARALEAQEGRSVLCRSRDCPRWPLSSPCIAHVRGTLNLLIDRASQLAATCSFGPGGWLDLLEQDEKAA
jgi:hypothetical protein